MDTIQPDTDTIQPETDTIQSSPTDKSHTKINISMLCFSEDDDVFGFYKISNMYYGMIAIGICMIVAAAVSAISGKI